MRVVGGRLRGRRLIALPDNSLRPTAERTRASLFDLLTQGRALAGEDAVRGARVLDAFAGTGALGIEALSRGATEAVFIESALAHCGILRQNLRALGLKHSARLVQADALLPPPAPAPVDLLLLDPPYGKGLAALALTALLGAGWLGCDSLVALEQAAKDAFVLPKGFHPLEERRYGRARIFLLTLG
ncbi:MAG: 16S rRNA (guanine(966)-N(2))-methyltransferase RsmD [Rhodospirillales bacterium]|nr:16S rRNA (guanine(966)-N(2))-methyltransferase RsmD [Rhodospirillales bacterium]